MELNIDYFEKLAKQYPNNPDIYYNLGILYYQKGLIDVSTKNYLKVLELNPKYKNAYNNLGMNLNKLRKFGEAIEIFKKGIALFPDYANLYYNIGVSYYESRLFDLAESSYIKAIQINPNYPKPAYALAGVYFMRGEYEKGWELYENRFFIDGPEKVTIPSISRPRWKGEDIKNKTIYVCKEQGFGDTIMFSRFVLSLQDIAGKVIFKPNTSLKKLFETSNFKAQIIEECVPEENIEFDVYSPLLSLPLMLKTNINNIPCPEGYLKADEEKINFYKNSYFNNDKFKVGICWQTSTETIKGKTVKLNCFCKLAEIENVQLYSLQKGLGVNEMLNCPESVDIINLGETFEGFSDTAAAIANLDLVITIDTSIAHLSGAMDKPTWIPLHTESEWRWMIDREDSPWYKSVKLFRQKQVGDWDEVFSRIYEKLQQF